MGAAKDRDEALAAHGTMNTPPRVVALAWRVIVVLAGLVAVLVVLVVILLVQVHGLKEISHDRHGSICAIQEAVGAPKVGECR